MRPLTRALVALAPVALALVACDAPIFCDGGSCDAGPARDAALDAGPDECVAGEVEESPDFADCLTDACPRSDTAVGMFALAAGGTETRLGRIDDATHRLASESCGGIDAQDSEVIAIRAPARAIVEVELAPQCASGAFSPWLAFDDALRLVHVAGAGAGETARLVFVQPYVDQPAYLRVEDNANLEPGCTEPVGGPGYGYRLTARVTDRGPRELGDLADGPRTAGGTSTRSGDLELFRFTGAPGTRVELRAELSAPCPEALHDTTRGLRRCVLHLVRMSPFRGNAAPVACDFEEELVWGAPRNDADAALELRAVVIPSEGEVLFAVTDFNGAGAEGYAYDVTVSESAGAVGDACTPL